MDLTMQAFPRTGLEKSLAELIRPDERASILVETTSGSLEPEDLQAGYFHAESRMPATVPKEVRERVHVARTLGAYAWFVHEFNAVSMFWSLSCIEMAVWVRFVELNPGPFKIKKGKQRDTVALTGIEDRIREKWRIEGMPRFDFSFRALITWASEAGLLPPEIKIDNVVKLRNIMAHPTRANLVTTPSDALGTYQCVINVVSALWHQ